MGDEIGGKIFGGEVVVECILLGMLLVNGYGFVVICI